MFTRQSEFDDYTNFWAEPPRMLRSGDVVWVLVRMEWPRSKLDRRYSVLDLVTRDPDATDRIMRQ
jgi:hypothetical protein